MKKYIDLFTNKECNLSLIYYSEDGKRHTDIVEYDWFFYLTFKDYTKIKRDFYTFKANYPDFRLSFKMEGDSWIRIYCYYPKRKEFIEKIKELKIQTYEADLSLNRRYWIDSNLHVAEPEYFKLLFIDIEVDDTISGLRIGEDQIISFAAIDNFGKKYQVIEKDEKILLKKVNRILKLYDIILGWNSFKYDIPFLQSRCEKYEIEFPNICHIDMMQRMIHAYRFDTNIKSFSLNSIAQYFLGEGKLEKTSKIIEMYKNNFEYFKKYNMRDVQLLKNLEDSYKIVQMLLKQVYWCNSTPRSLGQGGGGLYTLLDNLILKVTHNRNMKGLTPSYTFDELDKMTKEDLHKLDYPGALVLEPKLGIYKHVYMFDFKTLYPTIVQTSNIGFDSLDSNGEILNPSGAKFKKEPQSILSEVLTDLLTKRKEYKEKKLKLIEEGKKDTPEFGGVEADEVVVKELGNSVYGICGAKWGRYFTKREIVESITLMGQWLLRSLDDFFSKKEYTVITGDTDSIIISTEKQIDLTLILKEYHEYLSKRLKDECNIDESSIQLNFDKYFDKFIIVAKKNYAGHLTNQEGKKVDYIHVRGLASVKSDTCKLTADSVKELIELLLKTENNQQFYIDWLKNKRNTIFDYVSANDISIYKKIRQNIHKYKSKPLSAEIAEKFANPAGYSIHDEITYIVTGRNLQTHKLTGVEIGDYTGNFDKSYYWDNLILSNVSRLLKVVFPKIDWNTKTYQSYNQLTIF